MRLFVEPSFSHLTRAHVMSMFELGSKKRAILHRECSTLAKMRSGRWQQSKSLDKNTQTSKDP